MKSCVGPCSGFRTNMRRRLCPITTPGRSRRTLFASRGPLNAIKHFDSPPAVAVWELGSPISMGAERQVMGEAVPRLAQLKSNIQRKVTMELPRNCCVIWLGKLLKTNGMFGQFRHTIRDERPSHWDWSSCLTTTKMKYGKFLTSLYPYLLSQIANRNTTL